MLIRVSIDPSAVGESVKAGSGVAAVNLVVAALSALGVWRMTRHSPVSRRDKWRAVISCNGVLAVVLLLLQIIYFGRWNVGSNLAYLAWPMVMGALGIASQWLALKAEEK